MLKASREVKSLLHGLLLKMPSLLEEGNVRAIISVGDMYTLGEACRIHSGCGAVDDSKTGSCLLNHGYHHSVEWAI